MTPITCPTCGKKFDPRHGAALPFCSPRCRQIDLGRWLGGQYAVPGKPVEIAEDGTASEQPGDE